MLEIRPVIRPPVRAMRGLDRGIAPIENEAFKPKFQWGKPRISILVNDLR